MELEWKDIIILVQFVVIVIAMFGLYKSVPRDFVMIIMSFLESKAAATPDKTDDTVVAEVKKFIDQLMPAAKAPVPPAGDSPAG